jgi:hypothetical protein
MDITQRPDGLRTDGGRPSLARHVLAAAAVLSLAGAPPALAGPFDSIKNMMPGQKPKPDAKATEPTAMGMQASTPLPPLHGLGTDAVAVIETASPGAPVQAMDYVFAKQTITLGPKGRIVMSYLSGCLTETIQGGVVTVALRGSTVTGGVRTDRATPGCRSATPVVMASASEAGATVNRVTPFTGVNWSERALKSGQPVFKWDKAAGAVTLRVKDMDKEGEPVIWQVAVAREWIAYPPTGAKLMPGMPYKAEALAGDKVVAAALFSIDPALDVADNLAGRVVPLSAP